MNRKFFVFSILVFAFSVVFRGFSYLETGSGSGSKVVPSVAFKKWQIGRSPEGTSTSNKEHLSFITSTQKLCHFTASVGYGDIANKQNTSPINPRTVSWRVTNGTNMIELDTNSVQHNWSGKNPAKLDSSTLFNVVASVTVEEVVGTRTVEYIDKDGIRQTKQVPDYKKGWTACTSDADRAQRSPVHRDGTKMKFTLKFSAQTDAGQPVSAVLALEADDKDQLRQEYVDYGRPIPARKNFTGEDTYDFGHYNNMINKSLGDNFQNWIDAINRNYREGKKDKNENPLSTLKKADFTLNSGYRQPHHNFDHAGSRALMSPHMYGYALDVNGRDLDGKDGADQSKMVLAAYATDPIARYSAKYSGQTHVHADWAPTPWPNISSVSAPTFSLPPAGTDTVACDKQNENSCDVMVSSSTEHYVTCPNSKCGDSYWSCDSDDYDEHRLRTCTWTRLSLGENCGKSWRLCEYPVEQIKGTNLHTRSSKCVTDPSNNRHCADNSVNTAPSNEENTPDENVPITPVYHACSVHQTYVLGDHSLQASCSETDSHGQSCTVTNFYACQSHTHQYPALISGACGHSYTSSASYSHRSETCPTNANGDSCTSGSFYACQSHTHQYPQRRTCWRADCDVEVTDAADHKETCGSGAHSFWPGCPDLNVRSWHQRSYHESINCSRCGSLFRLCSNNNNSCSNGGNHRK